MGLKGARPRPRRRCFTLRLPDSCASIRLTSSHLAACDSVSSASLITAFLPLTVVVVVFVLSSFGKLDDQRPPTLPRHQAHHHHSSASVFPQLPSCACYLLRLAPPLPALLVIPPPPPAGRQRIPFPAGLSAPTSRLRFTADFVSIHPHATSIKQQPAPWSTLVSLPSASNLQRHCLPIYP